MTLVQTTTTTTRESHMLIPVPQVEPRAVIPAQNLRIPGPTPVPPAVLAELARPVINHRGPEFAAILRRVTARLHYVFQTTSPVLTFLSSGTGGQEGAIVNLFSPGEHVVAITIGHFGNRFAQIAERFGLQVSRIDFPWGDAADPAVVETRLRELAPYRGVLLTHNETSTGVTNDIQALAAQIRRHNPDALIVVDAVSSLGCIPLHMDAWDIDVAFSASQKGLLCPPGLMMLAAGPRAWEVNAQARLPRFYFDWASARASLERGQHPVTPPVSLFFALDLALELLLAEGLDAVFARHQRLGEYVRRHARAIGLQLLADSAHASNTVTAVRVPVGIDAKVLLNTLRERDRVVLAGGQEHLSGKILRIGQHGRLRGAGSLHRPELPAGTLAGAGVPYRQTERRRRGIPMVAIQAREAHVPRILITEPIAQEGIDLLRYELPEAHIDVRLDLSPERLLSLIGSYTTLIIRSQTRVTEELLAQADRLQIIGRAGSGLDNIDLHAAIRHGVLVVHAPRGNAIAVAEHTIALLLALARHIPAAASSMQAGRWNKSRLLGVELHSKVLGIIGLGRVGKEVAQRAQAFGMRVIACDPFVPTQQGQQAGVALHSKEEVLQRADFVTLHAALSENQGGTGRLLGARELSLLKPGACLVNCARGSLIDEKALLAVLTEGRLAGVALDVLSQEPIGDDAVLRQVLAHERVIATPHLGASTAEAQVRVATEVARNIISALQGDTFSGVATLPFSSAMPA